VDGVRILVQVLLILVAAVLPDSTSTSVGFGVVPFMKPTAVV
jgi:hypothetical protein